MRGRELFELEVLEAKNTNINATQPTHSSSSSNDNNNDDDNNSNRDNKFGKNETKKKQPDNNENNEQNQTAAGATSISGSGPVSIILAKLPSRFKSLVWLRVGGYVVVTPVDDSGKSKVTHEIVHVLTQKQLANLKKEGKWCGIDNSDHADEENKGGDSIMYKGGQNRVEIEESSSDDESDDDQ